MKFKSAQELLEFFNNLDLDKSTLVFKESEKDTKDCACGGSGPCQCPPPSNKTESTETVVTVDPAKEAILESLSDNPSFPLEFGEANTFFVKDFQTVPNACGTGRVTLENREMYINMCETNGVAEVDMSVNVGGQKLRNISFVLEKTDGPSRLILKKSYLETKEDAANT